MQDKILNSLNQIFGLPTGKTRTCKGMLFEVYIRFYVIMLAKIFQKSLRRGIKLNSHKGCVMKCMYFYRKFWLVSTIKQYSIS